MLAGAVSARGDGIDAGGAWLGLRQMRSILVVGQMALAIVLLVGAGLMLRSFVRLMTTRTGFEPEGLLTLQVTSPQGLSGEAWGAAVRQIEQRMASIPGTNRSAQPMRRLCRVRTIAVS